MTRLNRRWCDGQSVEAATLDFPPVLGKAGLVTKIPPAKRKTSHGKLHGIARRLGLRLSVRRNPSMAVTSHEAGKMKTTTTTTTVKKAKKKSKK